jgi:hypothetical protein
MTLWRKARTEVAGVWRSVRYDLGRPEPDADELRERRQLLPRPRRVLVVSVFGCLAVAGAAGGYFAVVTGLGSLVGDKQTGVEPYPLAVEAPRDEPAHSGLGGGSADTGGRAPAKPAPGTVRVLPATSVVPAATVAPATVVPESPEVVVPLPRQTTVSEKPVTDCCPTTSTPSPPPSESPSPSPSVSSPDTVDSPEPSESPSPVMPSWPEDIGELDEDFVEPGLYEDPWHPAHHP